jgi:hypothetical protein
MLFYYFFFFFVYSFGHITTNVAFNSIYLPFTLQVKQIFPNIPKQALFLQQIIHQNIIGSPIRYATVFSTLILPQELFPPAHAEGCYLVREQKQDLPTGVKQF